MDNSLPFIFKRRLFVFLTAGFLLASQIGMFFHECGHYVVAKYLGYSAQIGYGRTYFENTDSIGRTFENSMLKNRDNVFTLDTNNFFGNQKLLELRNKKKREEFWIRLGGPLETILTGTIGFVLLLTFRNSFKKVYQLTFKQWIIIYTALFWLRQPSNFLIYCGRLIAEYPSKTLSRYNGDEIFLAHYFKLPEWSILGATGIMGAVLLCIIVFKFIPATERLTFIISGLVGGAIGLLFVHL